MHELRKVPSLHKWIDGTNIEPMNPFDPFLLRALARRYGTPLWVYDAATVRARIAALRSFDVIRYAQKANANVHLLRLMRSEGVKVDAVSLGEIERAYAAGYGRDEIVFTADLFDTVTLQHVVTERLTVNAGSVDMLQQLGALSPGHRVWLRINPGFGHGHSHKTNTGGEHSKHGIWHADLGAALAAIAQHGLYLVGLHMHIGSGVDYVHLNQVCQAMVALAAQVPLAIPLHAVSAGGGLSTPNRPSDASIDPSHYFGLWDAARRQIAAARGHALELEIEPGRYLVAESGVLLAEVRAVKDMGRNHFVLVNAGFNELMRPAMYGAHHEIELLSADGSTRALRDTVVAGPLCESGDVFTQGEGGVVRRHPLAEGRVGDLVVFHDTGAYGSSMSSNYNSRPLAAEVLIEGGEPRLIRRRQTIAELLALESV
jgi:diaminopimelate decarboxylase